MPAPITLMVPPLLRADPRSLSPIQRREVEQFGAACRHQPDLIRNLFERMVPRVAAESATTRTLDELLEEFGFNRTQHEEIRADLRDGRIGLAKNRLPVNFSIEDAAASDVLDAEICPQPPVRPGWTRWPGARSPSSRWPAVSERGGPREPA